MDMVCHEHDWGDEDLPVSGKYRRRFGKLYVGDERLRPPLVCAHGLRYLAIEI